MWYLYGPYVSMLRSIWALCERVSEFGNPLALFSSQFIGIHIDPNLISGLVNTPHPHLEEDTSHTHTILAQWYHYSQVVFLRNLLCPHSDAI